MSRGHRMVPNSKRALRGGVLRTLCGLALIVGAVWYCFHMFGNPATQLCIIRGGEIVTGHVLEAYESDPEVDGVSWGWSRTYTFQLPDGRTITGESHGTGDVDLFEGDEVLIEYDPESPARNRLWWRGWGGVDHFRPWLDWYATGALFLAVLAAPGVWCLCKGVGRLRARCPHCGAWLPEGLARVSLGSSWRYEAVEEPDWSQIAQYHQPGCPWVTTEGEQSGDHPQDK